MDWWVAALGAAFVTGLAVVAVGAGSAAARLFLAASRHGSASPPAAAGAEARPERGREG